MQTSWERTCHQDCELKTDLLEDEGRRSRIYERRKNNFIRAVARFRRPLTSFCTSNVSGNRFVAEEDLSPEGITGEDQLLCHG